MRAALRYLLLLFIVFNTVLVYAQKEANVWYFGNFLGLDFNSGTAVALNNGQLTTTEGVATISDKNGNLLFYTEGTKVWNRLHQVMPNGTNLFGSYTSSQSAVIVPMIGDTTRYYVFTVDAESGPRGLTYSIVNMTLDNGNGDIEQKNLPLVSNVVEKVTAVRHCNNRDIWVLAHGSVSNIYYAFLVNPSGISAPVISNTGSVLWGVLPPGLADSTSLGYMKASPDGKKIAAAHWTVNVDISDFDNATGIVSNSYGLQVPGDPHYLNYGVEFSPDSRLVYMTAFFTDPVSQVKRNALFQYDVSLATPAAVRASKQIISQNSDPIQTYSALQVAPDGKMYMSKNTYKHVAAVTSPNVYGPGCGFVSNAVQFTLANQNCSFGLPTFIQSYFYPPDSFTYNIPCPGNDVSFNYAPRGGVTSVLWDFGDPTSGINNTSTQYNPTHQYAIPGNYTVKMIKFTVCGNDTIKRTITTDVLNINLGADTLVCGGTNVLLNPAGVGSLNTYLWQNGSSNPTFLATTAGLYWVEVRNNVGCSFRDSITVDFKPSPTFELGTDTFICQGNTASLNASAAAADNYLWSNGATTSTIQPSQAGLYWCQANKGGCIFRDSITITVRPSPVVNLGNDTTVCEGITLTYDAGYLNSTYLWQDGSTNSVFTVTTPGAYHVQVNYNGCKRSDTIRVDHDLKPVFTLGPDQLICAGNPVLLHPALNPTWQISWQDGSTSPTFTVSQAGIYSLTAINQCGSSSDEVLFTRGTCKVAVPNAFSPNNDRTNDVFRVLGIETVKDFNLKIFNRWGQIVFESSDKNKGWDGRIKGIESPVGTYVYVLRFNDIFDPTPQFVKGTIVLIR